MKQKTKAGKIIRRTVLGLLGLWAILLIVMQIILSSAFLTRTVNKIAAEYIDGDVSFGKVSASVFKRFPKVTVTLDSVLVSYPTDRFAAEEQGRDFHLRAGKSAAGDTLAAFDRFSASLNVLSLLGGQIRMPQLELTNPHIFAKSYNEDKANWNIFKLPAGTEDAGDAEDDITGLPYITVDEVRLDGRPFIVYLSKKDSLYAAMSLKSMEFDGRFSTRNTSRNRIKFNVDSLFVGGRLKTDTLAIGLDRLSIDEHKEHIDVSLAAKSFLASRAFGRKMIPINIKSHVKFNPDTVPSLSIHDFRADIGELPINADADIKYHNDRLWVDGSVVIDKAISLSMTGDISDFSGTDPLYDIDASFEGNLDTLGKFLPDSSGMSISGDISAKAQGGIRQSQLSAMKLAGSGLRGFVKSDRLEFHSEADSIDVKIDSLGIMLAALDSSSKYNHIQGNAISLVTRLDSTFIRFKDILVAEGKQISLVAQNDLSLLEGSDSSSVYPFSGMLRIGMLKVMDSDSSRVSIRDSKNSFTITPSEKNDSIPVLKLKSNTGSVWATASVNRAAVRNLAVNISATQREKRVRTQRGPRKASFGTTPDWMSEEDFKASDFDFKLDDMFIKYYREWSFSGNLAFARARLITPYFPLRTKMDSFNGYITNNTLTLNKFTLTAGQSELSAEGKLTGLRGALTANRPVTAELAISSDSLNVNELLGAYSLGASYSEEGNSLFAHDMDDELYQEIVAVDNLTETESAEPSLIVVPSNLNANLKLDANNVVYSDFLINSLKSEMVMKERCLQLTNTEVKTNVGNLTAEAFYSTRTKKDLKAGFNLNFTGITADKIIDMIPAVDSLMPALKSFRGLLGCEIAATTQIDTNMNIIIPSLNGIVRITGKDLALVESQDLYKIAKLLKIRNKENIRIDDMIVEGLIGNNKVEIFPFLLTADRYTLALSGIQHIDQSFKYHISVLKSPLVIRFGVNLWGPDFDNMKFKIGRAKYRIKKMPVFTAVIDDAKINLSKSINDIFTTGVNAAIRENERQAAMKEYKESIQYQNAAETAIEPLSEEESKQFEAETPSHPDLDSGSNT